MPIILKNKVDKDASMMKPIILTAAIIMAGVGITVHVNAAVLEEIKVTAQKREQNLQDVGIAVNAFSGEQMRALGFSDSTEIVAMTPGVHLGGNLAGQNLQYTIRGVAQNDFSDHTESPVATYVDGAYIAMAQGQKFAMFDVERVEVLKGPQGTLFGRNATGGLVHFVSNKPTRENEAFVELEYGDFNKTRVEAAISGALSSAVSARLSGTWSDHDGWLDNDYVSGGPGTIPGNESPELALAGSGDDLGGQEDAALRGQLLIDLSENLNLWLSVNWADSEASSSPYQSEPTVGLFDQYFRQVGAIDAHPDLTHQYLFANGEGAGISPSGPRPVPGGDFTGWIDPDGPGVDHSSSDFAFNDLNTMKTYGLSGKLEWELDGMTLVALSDYKNFDKFMGMDVGGAPMNQLSVWFDAEVWQFTQEIRLQGETDRMRWVTGIYGMHVEYDNAIGFKALNGAGLLLPPTAPPFSVDLPAKVGQETDSYSIFGQADYDLTATLTLTAGLRLIQEEKDYDYSLDVHINPTARGFAEGPRLGTITQATNFGAGFEFFPAQTSFSGDSSDTLWTGKIQLDWRPADNLLLYAGINRGVKAGGFNAPIDFGDTQNLTTDRTNPFAPRLVNPDFEYEYDEEVLTSFEIGFKSTLFDGTTRFNGSAFYYDYKDYQSFLFSGVSGIVVNNDADVFGAELEMVSSPVEGLDVMFGLAVFDAEVDDVATAPAVYDISGSLISAPIFDDVEPSYAPPFQASGLLRYGWPVFGGELAVQVDFSYSDSSFLNLRNYDSHKLDSYILTNARLSYATEDESWEIATFVNNLTDEENEVMGFDISLFCGCSELSVGTPRWWGMQVRYNMH